MSSSDSDHINEMNGETDDEYHLDIQRELDDDRVVLDDDLEEDEVDEEGSDEIKSSEGASKKPKNTVLFVAAAIMLGVGGFVVFSNLSGSPEKPVPVVAEYSDPNEPEPVVRGAGESNSSHDGADLQLVNSASSSPAELSLKLNYGSSASSAVFTNDISLDQGLSQQLSSSPQDADSASGAMRVVSQSSVESTPVKAATYVDKPLVQDRRIAPGVAVGSIYSTVTSKGDEVVASSALSSASSSDSSVIALVVGNSMPGQAQLNIAEKGNSVQSGDLATSDKSAEMYAVLQSIKAELENIKREQKAIHDMTLNNKDNISKISKVGVASKSSTSSLSARDKLTLGRERLPGFQVVQASDDKTMSIVRVSKAVGDNIVVLYSGESFRSSVAGIIKVKSIIEGGLLVLAGDKWFIDDVMVKPRKEDRPRPSKSASSKISATSSSRSSNSSVASMIIAPKKPVAGNQYQATAPSSVPSGATGWALNVTYNDTYIVTSPSGDPIQVKRGETLKDLGVVIGLDGENRLKVGNYLISAP